MKLTPAKRKKLLEAVRSAGRYPDADVVRDCVQHVEALKGQLLEILATDPTEPEYRVEASVLAGLVLIEGRVPEALDALEAIYRDPVREPAMSPWFDRQIPAYGTRAIMHLRRIVLDDAAFHEGRLSCVEIMNSIAKLYPEARPGVVSAFRSVLQRQTDAAAHHRVELWSWIISCLVDLGDSGSSVMVSDLIDRDLTGDREDEFAQYVALLKEGIPSPEVTRPLKAEDLFARVREWEQMSAGEIIDRYRTKLESDSPDEDASALLSIVLARYLPERDPPAVAEHTSDLVSELRVALANAGVDADRLDDAVRELVITVFAAGDIHEIQGGTRSDDGSGTRAVRLRLALSDQLETAS